MEISLLTQCDFALNKCGRPTAPKGLSVVYIPRGFLVQNYFGPATAATQATITKEITGDTTWCLRDIQSTSSSATAISFQVLLPNGHFLINNLQDVLQVAGYGSYRYLFAKELECPPGSKLQVTFLDTNTGSGQPIALLFGGAYKYFLKGANGVCTTMEAAAAIPRYLRNFNENIMAPCWQQGIGPVTPRGLRDIEWVYSPSGPPILLPGGTTQAAISIDVAAGPFSAIQTIPIDQGSDFRCRRLLFRILADNTVTGATFLGKVRTGSGYALCDDYFDLATYIGSAPMAKDWEIKAGDAAYVDLQLADYSGTGKVYIQTFLEGTKRMLA